LSRSDGCFGRVLPKVCGRNGIAWRSAAQPNLKQTRSIISRIEVRANGDA
jgi:hypothetical protein